MLIINETLENIQCTRTNEQYYSDNMFTQGVGKK